MIGPFPGEAGKGAFLPLKGNMNSIKIGSTFRWNGKVWEVYGFSAHKILIKSGSFKTTIDREVLESLSNEG